LKLLLDGEVSAESRKLLEESAAKNDPATGDPRQRLAQLVHAILTMPEYQLA
jgi:hypothetical protein